MNAAQRLAKKVLDYERDYPQTQGSIDAPMTIPGATWNEMVEWARASMDIECSKERERRAKKDNAV